MAVLATTAAFGAFVSWSVANLMSEGSVTSVDVVVFVATFTTVFAAAVGSHLQKPKQLPTERERSGHAASSVLNAATALTAASHGALVGVAGLFGAATGCRWSNIALEEPSKALTTAAWVVGFAVIASLLASAAVVMLAAEASPGAALMVCWFIGEGTLNRFANEHDAPLLPFSDGYRVLLPQGTSATHEPFAITNMETAVIFGVYVAAPLVIGALLVGKLMDRSGRLLGLATARTSACPPPPPARRVPTSGRAGGQ